LTKVKSFVGIKRGNTMVDTSFVQDKTRFSISENIQRGNAIKGDSTLFSETLSLVDDNKRVVRVAGIHVLSVFFKVSQGKIRAGEVLEYN